MAPMVDTHHISQLSQCTCNIACHALGLTVLPVFMYYLSRFLRLKLLGDTISQEEVNRDTAAIARVFALVNVIVVAAATLIYSMGLYQSCGEFEVFVALLDVAMTASWVCVCLIPLELYCARQRREEEEQQQKETNQDDKGPLVDLGDEEPDSSAPDSSIEEEKHCLLQPGRV